MTRVIERSRVERLPVPQAIVGESVRWEARRNALFHVDILGRQLRRFDPATGDFRAWDMDELIGGWFPTRDGRLLLAMQTGLYWFDPECGARERYCDLEADQPLTRANDGRCDPQGRLWISTMDMVNEPRTPIGGLYRVAPGEAPVKVLGGLCIPNALAWSPDGGTMYFADSPRRVVWQFDFDGERGEISNRREFFALDEGAPGVPDGACTDVEGGIWIAIPQGGRVERRMPDGSLDAVIETPAERPTMCGFGGPGLDTLYVTSLSRHLSDAERARRPDEGALFAVRPGVTGLPEPLFG